MAKVRNILFVMCDQLRADYLSCMGHPTLETPNIDRLASRSVLFERAYVQAPVCGPARMSFYTGLYTSGHGSTYNGVPLAAGIPTMGDFLRPHGLRVALVGKSHMAPDPEGMERLGLDPASPAGILVRECGFEPFERDDGLHPDLLADPQLPYNRFLRQQGYPGDNPWHHFANSAAGPGGEILSGWYLRNAGHPARIQEKHSETAYMTDRAMEFMDQAGDNPWCLHLSYIKPHWPYMAPAPYHALYGPDDVAPANRAPGEREDPHPVHAAFMNLEESLAFQRQETRRTVIPTYMGLVKQIDDNLGRLFSFLDERRLWDHTLVVFTSDHGDYLGDHWLGEKELFHEEAIRIPLIIHDPDPDADASRGTRNVRLVESIDLLPTFIDAVGGEAQPHRLEGRSLLPLLRGRADDGWRDAVFCESDYSFRGARLELGLAPGEARAFMIRTGKWKYIHYEGFRPQLFDLEGDPGELRDLGNSPAHEGTRAELHERLFQWLRRRPVRTTMSDAEVERRTGTAEERGFIIGVW